MNLETSGQNEENSKPLRFGKSWEAELLISGGALFTLIQITISMSESITKALAVAGWQVSGMTLLPVATAGLVGGFSIHLILRGFWVSLVMLQNIYPLGINFEKLKLAEPYLTKAKKFNLQQKIESLDIICSKVFVFAFAFTFLIIGFTIVYFAIMLPLELGDIWPSLHQNLFYSIISVVPVICYFLFLYVDLLTGGFLRRGKIIPKLYYPIYIVFNILSLGFLWRPIINILFTNAKSKSFLILLIILFYTFGFLFVVSFVNNKKDIVSLVDARKYTSAPILTNDQHYEDQRREDSWVPNATIQSKIITDEYLDVFVPYSSFDDEAIDSLKLETRFFSSILKLKLDDTYLDSLQWVGINKSNEQSGATSVINISNLKIGLHSLIIDTQNGKSVEIPFWRQ